MESELKLALYQPDIPQNTGALIRLGACLGVPLDVIEPCGFHLDDRRLRRAGLDYLERATITRHRSWDAYRAGLSGRLILLTTRAAVSYGEVRFAPGDSLLLGRESCGVPEAVRQRCDAAVTIPMRPGLRSLNQALAATLVLGEALRQVGALARLAHATPATFAKAVER
ncbi:MAG: tRNA (cytidine(34)-2'-O)-methyltransferase [Kiloniellales bacterium]